MKFRFLNILSLILIIILLIPLVTGCTPRELVSIGLEVAKEQVKEEAKRTEEIRNRYQKAIEIEPEENLEKNLHHFIYPILNSIFGRPKLTDITYTDLPEFGISAFVPLMRYILPRLVVGDDGERIKQEVEKKGYIAKRYETVDSNVLIVFSKNGDLLFGVSIIVGAQEILVGGSLDKTSMVLLFFDDFEDYGLGQEAPFGPWKSLRGGRIQQSVEMNNRIGKVLACGETGGVGVFVDKMWEDYIFMYEAKGEYARAYFRLTKTGDAGYYLETGYGVKLVKFAGRDSKVIASAQRTFDYESWNLFLIKLSGYKISVYVNGLKIIDIVDKDPTLRMGGIGFGTGTFWAYFNNVKVFELK